MTWMRKSTATMMPREMRLKKLQVVIDEQSPMWIKLDFAMLDAKMVPTEEDLLESVLPEKR